jgi:AraC-like DNA-binding protein
MKQQEVRRNTQRIRDNKEELVERMARAVPEDGTLEAFPGFRFSRSSGPTEPVRSVYQPSFCFVAQGSKRALLGEEVFRYDPEHYMIYTVDLPLTFQVEEASEERPYFGFQLDLEPALVASVIMESGIRFKNGDASIRAMNVSSVDADLLDGIVRLVRLVETPAERKVLAPLIIREIIYRLLIGGQGGRLSHILASGGDTRRISKAIGHLREHFNEQLKMEEIARELGMSVSGFHHHFKSVTSMSPLQFQKHLRLQEARRLMLGEDMDAASAGFRVGYEDPSHFSREYKRHFGAPPHGDIASLRSRLEV